MLTSVDEASSLPYVEAVSAHIFAHVHHLLLGTIDREDLPVCINIFALPDLVTQPLQEVLRGATRLQVSVQKFCVILEQSAFIAPFMKLVLHRKKG